MPPRPRLILPILLAVAVGATEVSAQSVVIDHNAGATPTCCAWQINVVGWLYTPTTTFFLSMIETRFGIQGFPYDARTVTAEVRSAPGGTVLGSASFASSASVADWVGGSFAPVLFTAGVTYFIDFVNVGPTDGGGFLGTNVLVGAPTGGFSAYQFGSDPNGPLSINSEVYDPIIRLTGSETTTATPEPATLTLVATGLAGAVGAARRRRSRGVLLTAA